MLLFLPISLLFAVTSGLKAVPFGETKSAETLFSLSSSSSSTVPSFLLPEPTQHDHIKEENNFSESITDHDPSNEHSRLSDEELPIRGFRMDDHFHNKDGDDWGLYVPIELESGKTIVRQAVGLEKRAGHRGTLQFDCKKAPDVCRNAGYYQNCLRGAKGHYRSFVYTNGPLEDKSVKGTPAAYTNRFNSGVATTWSTPCRAWPFAQLFWHPQEPPGSPLPKEGLQTDEWPMATMITGAFGTVPVVSLRCMTQDENKAGARQVTDFRRPQGKNAPYKKGNKWAKYRTSILDTEHLALGDTYWVNFSFDSFPSPGKRSIKSGKIFVRDTLGYAEWSKDSDCKNDGLQFHLSALRQSDRGGETGKLGVPYDSKEHSAYRLSGEQKDIEQFKVTLVITGKNQDQVTADVSYQNDGKWKKLVKNNQKVQPGNSFTLKEGLPKELMITRMQSGCDYEFVYASSTDAAFFKFSTRTIAYGEAKQNKNPKPNKQELYCDKTTVSSNNAGIEFECTFPGW